MSETFAAMYEQARTQREIFALRVFSLFFVAAALLALALVGEDMRYVLGPAVVVIMLVLLYLCIVSGWDRRLPLFEVATFFVLATAVYSIVPLAQYAMAGFTFGPVSDNRLIQLQPTPREFGGFAWRHVVLLATFVLTYLPARGRRLWPLRDVARPSTVMTIVIVWTAVALTGSLWALNLYVDPSNVYAGGTGTEYLRMPHVLLQVANVSGAVLLTLKQCLVIILLMGWRRRSQRVGLVLWLLAEIAITVAMAESRTTAVMLLLTAVVGYHRIVKPLRVKSAVIVGTVLLGFVLIFGLFRDIGAAGIRQDRSATVNAANEFQILYGTAYDIYYRKINGMLPPVPPQMYFADFYRLIPSQLLPFYKWDPAEWYVDILELRGTGAGLMFGVIAQGVIGFGWIELIVRGALLALFHAFVHRVYRRYSVSFWATIIYLFILSWVYFAFRSTSFEIFYRLVYYLGPTLIIVKVLTILLSRVTREISRGVAATSPGSA
jgi:hypothetical protein